MVERLKNAIEKARERRNALAETDAAAGARPPAAAGLTDRAAWDALPLRTLDATHLLRRRVVNHERSASVNPPFDLLRTRLLKVCAENGWRNIGVTSPTKGCGKTMLTANLAFSLARTAATYTIVLDFDLRFPQLAATLGLAVEGTCAEMLQGVRSHDSVLVRVSDRLAFGLNASPVVGAAELLQAAAAREALRRMNAALSPTIVLYDLPPMLGGDDTIGFMDQLDAVLLVAAAGETTAAQIEECDQLLGNSAPLIGVVLNKCEAEGPEGYPYDYTAA